MEKTCGEDHPSPLGFMLSGKLPTTKDVSHDTACWDESNDYRAAASALMKVSTG